MLTQLKLKKGGWKYDTGAGLHKRGRVWGGAGTFPI